MYSCQINQAAKQDTGLSLLVPSDVGAKGRYSFVVSEFRRALGVTLCRGNMALKIARAPLIAREASVARQQAAASNLPVHGGFRSTDRPSWYVTNALDQEAFKAWDAFRAQRHMQF